MDKPTPALPEPPVPADADLRHFHTMDLNVRKVMDSDLMALSTGDEFKAAFRLWCKAWHQVPAGSVPNDDRVLATLAGLEGKPRMWAKVRDMALRGFILCSDNRLYHPEVVAVVMSAVKKSRAGRDSAGKRWGSKSGDLTPGKTTQPAMPPQSEPKAEGDGLALLGPGPGPGIPSSPQGDGHIALPKPGGVEGGLNTPPAGGLFGEGLPEMPTAREIAAKVALERAAQFDQFWRVYPKKEGKAAAQKAWPRAADAAPFPTIVAAAAAYARKRAGEDPKFTKHASTWLNNRCWEDEHTGGPGGGHPAIAYHAPPASGGGAPEARPTPQALDAAIAHATSMSQAAGHPARTPQDPLFDLWLKYPHRDLEDPNAWVTQFFRTGFWPEHLGANPESPDCKARPSAIAAARNSI